MKIRNALKTDLDGITSLLLSLALPSEGVSDHLDDFLVLEDRDKVIGTVGLELYEQTALLRSLAVAPSHQGQGYGEQLFQHILQRARAKEIKEIVLLTETAQKFFAQRGFKTIHRETVNADVRKSVEFTDCCPDSAVCMHIKLGI